MPEQTVTLVSKTTLYSIPLANFPLAIAIDTADGPKQYRLNLHRTDDGQIRSMTLT